MTGKSGPRVGRPAELDAHRIVATALALADRDGLRGASLTKVAAALHVTPMSLYRHIGSRDGLTDLMADTAFGPPPAIGPDWRPALRAWANGQRTAFTRHPWITQIPVTGPPRGGNALAWMNAGLAALRDTGLDWRAKIGAITVVGGYVRQAFVTDRHMAERRGAEQRSEAQDLEAYQHDVSAFDLTDLPEVAALFADRAFADVPPDEESSDHDFTFGLELILDGIAAAIAGSGQLPGS
ncbi:TetR/AcrR family transcriptional regulator C-terminal domain-containing protein [Nocardia caishijiensis]|uniref:TetR family transcriptional regulator n=1 Tax=Nocardia caishijiensis TaxID=184756 RepID=A0ABQ6YFJ3_9NOCA|nr:TetR/AcrR family transcriptional regulator C-terminal domain-containing protein [Nocardia caishijiensis]KAF0836667.1 TetR family transcriptional regulator [Nocardia caishijiensis]